MTQRWTKVSRRMLFAWCLLGGLICLFAPQSLTGKLQLAYTSVFSWPLQKGRDLTLATNAISSLHAVNGPDDGALTAEHRRLRNHIGNLNAQLAEAHREIDRLAGIRVEPQWDRVPSALIPADVTVASQGQNVLFINRGQQDGVAVGQYVLGDLSIIGTIASVSPQGAKVRLITDPASKIPVTIGESDLDRLMYGQSGNAATLRPLIPDTHAIRKGDKVYAKKMPGLLEVPVIAGVVAQCKRDPENPSFWDITVQPVCDITTLTGVAVIMPASQPR
jgi:rod shape-determining protein MreC